jgi:hypothetical protein
LRSLRRHREGHSSNVAYSARVEKHEKEIKEAAETGIARDIIWLYQILFGFNIVWFYWMLLRFFGYSTVGITGELSLGAINDTGMAVPSVTGNTESSRESPSGVHANTGKYDCAQSPSVATYLY